MIPAQAPYEGGEPTMRKGSYSEELFLRPSGRLLVHPRHQTIYNP